MQPEEMPEVTANVKKALEVFLDDPQLVRDFNQVLATLYERAGVHLTYAEKAALLNEIAATFRKPRKGIQPDG